MIVGGPFHPQLARQDARLGRRPSLVVGVGGPSSSRAAAAVGLACPSELPWRRLQASRFLPQRSWVWAAVCAGCGNDRDTSLVFGVQVGYNYQFSPGSGFVVGVEADAQFLGEQGSSNRRGGVTGTTLVTPASVGTPPFGSSVVLRWCSSAPTPSRSSTPGPRKAKTPIGSGRFGCGSDMPSIAGWCTGQAGLPIRSAAGLIRLSPSPPISARSPRRTASAARNNNCDDTHLRAGVNYRFGTM